MAILATLLSASPSSDRGSLTLAHGVVPSPSKPGTMRTSMAGGAPFVDPEGVEPSTSRLRTGRSPLLSYEPSSQRLHPSEETASCLFCGKPCVWGLLGWMRLCLQPQYDTSVIRRKDLFVKIERG